MDVWKKIIGRKVYLLTKHGRTYEGTIEGIDDSDKPLIYISLIDKNGKTIVLCSAEIAEIKEEE